LGLKEDILFLEIVYFLFGESSAATMAGGAKRPVGRGNEPKETGARSARARTRGQNPLVSYIFALRLRFYKKVPGNKHRGR
jgi:hypothetical protein